MAAFALSRVLYRNLVLTHLLTSVVIIWLCFNVYQADRIVEVTRDRDFNSQQLQGTITHLDEVLTQSARLAAATRDPAWEERYRQYEPQLDQAIQAAKRLCPPERADRLIILDQANRRLVAMETQAFALIHQGRSGDALALLTGSAYREKKQVYAASVSGLMRDNSIALNAALATQRARATLSVVLALGAILVSSAAWLAVLRLLERRNVALHRSLVEKARVEQALRENEAHKELFLHMVSHELSNPLAVITSAIEVIKRQADTSASAPSQTHMQRIERAARRLATLVRDLLEAAQLGKGHFHLAQRWVDLRAVAAETLGGLGAMAAEKAVQLKLEADEVPPVFADEQRLHQVLTNLVHNAIKFGGRRNVITVTVRLVDRRVRCEVRDQGPGISVADQAGLFQRFGGLAIHSLNPDKGLGLGLFIAHSLIDAHGGQIGVQSGEGLGACFYVDLPVADTTDVLSATDRGRDICHPNA